MDNHTNHGDSAVQSSALPHAAVTPSPRKKKKLLHIEFLRILCIWLVMFTHSATSGFSLYIPMQHSRWFPLYILVPFWVKISVPIFFMISGALLLGKDEPISVVFRKRIWRFSQVLVIFSFISYVAVYRNLNLLADMGEALKITTLDGGDRFDGCTKPHYHFACTSCGAVIDLDMDVKYFHEMNEAAGKNFDGLIESHTTLFSGICPACLKKAKINEKS